MPNSYAKSIAIVKYLQAKFNCPEHWYPSDLKTRAKVDEYLAWQHMNTRINTAKVFLKSVIIPRMTSTPHDPAALSPDILRMNESLDSIEDYFLGDKPFLCGDEISIADLFCINEVLQMVPTPYNSLDRRPKMKAWIERVRQRLDPKLYDEVTMMIIKLGAIVNAQPKL